MSLVDPSVIDAIYNLVPPLPNDEEAFAHLREVASTIADRDDVMDVMITVTIDGRSRTIEVRKIPDKTQVD